MGLVLSVLKKSGVSGRQPMKLYSKNLLLK